MGTRMMDHNELIANMVRYGLPLPVLYCLALRTRATGFRKVNVELPLPAHIQPTIEIYALFLNKLLVQRKMYSTHFHHNGVWWTRCSAQVWNEVRIYVFLSRRMGLTGVCIAD